MERTVRERRNPSVMEKELERADITKRTERKMENSVKEMDKDSEKADLMRKKLSTEMAEKAASIKKEREDSKKEVVIKVGSRKENKIDPEKFLE